MIPTGLKIDNRVRPLLRAWMDKQLKENPPKEEDETCEMSSSFTFHGYASGIGDSWWVTRGGKSFAFGVDDDNEVYTKELGI